LRLDLQGHQGALREALSEAKIQPLAPLIKEVSMFTQPIGLSQDPAVAAFFGSELPSEITEQAKLSLLRGAGCYLQHLELLSEKTR
jgi:hypothetical protein